MRQRIKKVLDALVNLPILAKIEKRVLDRFEEPKEEKKEDIKVTEV